MKERQKIKKERKKGRTRKKDRKKERQHIKTERMQKGKAGMGEEIKE